jgi:hypothetical protein
MKRLITAFNILLLATLPCSLAFADSHSQPKEEWLFVHTSTTAEMTSETTLVMPVTREIFAFTDRPNRQHGYMTAHAFVSLWDEAEGDTFKADPPNAVLTWIDGDKVHEAEVVITNASVLAHGRAISFEVKLGAGEAPGVKLQGVSLFVDSYVSLVQLMVLRSIIPILPRVHIPTSLVTPVETR